MDNNIPLHRIKIVGMPTILLLGGTRSPLIASSLLEIEQRNRDVGIPMSPTPLLPHVSPKDKKVAWGDVGLPILFLLTTKKMLTV